MTKELPEFYKVNFPRHHHLLNIIIIIYMCSTIFPITYTHMYTNLPQCANLQVKKL
jgi:hypothetical protein